ncbi:MAG TPA: SPOR domain-containing protein [Spirochaetia bacterium]|nr:SPOR domain-containing protein [Spirochaetia bacterium]
MFLSASIAAQTQQTVAQTPQNSAPDLVQARSYEEAGKSSDAFDEYEKWLDKNEQSPAYLETLLHAAQTAPTVGQAIGLLKKGVEVLKGAADRSAVYAAMGTAAELAGDVEHAEQYYEISYLDSPSGGTRNYGSLVRAAELSFELGRVSDAANRAQLIVTALGSAAAGTPAHALVVSAQLLLARVEGDQHGPHAGYEEASPLLEDPQAGPGVLLFIVESAHAAGEPDAALEALDQLKLRFPDSPEYVLGRDVVGTAGSSASPKVYYLPSPSRILGPLQAELASPPDQTPSTSQAPAPLSAPPTDDHAPVTPPVVGPTESDGSSGSPVPSASSAIQAGSFRDRSNAEALLKELSGKGYHGEIRQTTVGKELYYKVILPAKSGDEQNLLIRLRGDGYEGFVLPN